MKTRPFGPTDEDIPIIGQGTWQLRDPARAAAALRLGVDLGMTHIDTAELYRGSEQVIADAVGDRRDDRFIVSKVLPHHASYRGTLDACQQSLERLEMDTLDVYLLHWWSDSHPLEDTMRAMGELVDDGTIRHIGVSNFSVAQMEQAQQALGTKHPLVCNQVLYHLTARGIENDVLPYCQEHDIALVGYSPFGSGSFPTPDSPGGRALAEIAETHEVTRHQVALNFLARRDGVFLIPKAETEEHVRQNASALDFELTEQDVTRIEKAFPLSAPGPLQTI